VGSCHFEILLLDEPTALLDPDSQLNLVPAVQRLVKNCGLTALWVTHRLDKLNDCDGAFLLEKCEVLDRGDAPRLKQRLMQIQEV
jgi:energy-coupling factor transport system ATP-binding protein